MKYIFEAYKKIRRLVFVQSLFFKYFVYRYTLSMSHIVSLIGVWQSVVESVVSAKKSNVS